MTIGDSPDLAVIDMRVVIAILMVASAAGCGFAPLHECTQSLTPGERRECPMHGWLDRGFAIAVPASWDGSSAVPVLLALHGGGGNRHSAEQVTCPDGDTGEPACLGQLALREGYVVIRPDGTGARPTRNARTWNAGGGVNGYNCASGGACRSGVDDLRYFDQLLELIAMLIPVDPGRIYVTGLSNGGAMSHRLACQRSHRFAAIVAVGGGNQHAVVGGSCDASVPVLQIHGTEDPCWEFEAGTASCLGTETGIKAGVAETMEGWRVRNGCSEATTEEMLPDREPGDGTRVALVRWTGCAPGKAVELMRIEGGGHTWPGGYAYMDEDRIGRVSRDIGSDIVLGFFGTHIRE